MASLLHISSKRGNCWALEIHRFVIHGILVASSPYLHGVPADLLRGISPDSFVNLSLPSVCIGIYCIFVVVLPAVLP